MCGIVASAARSPLLNSPGLVMVRAQMNDIPLTSITRADRFADFAVAFLISAVLLSIGVLLFVVVAVVLVLTFGWLF